MESKKLWIIASTIFIVSIAIPIVWAGTLRAGDNQDVGEMQFTVHLDQNVQDLMSAYSIPGVSILIIKEGEVVWSKAYGFANIEQRKKMTLDAICRAESISKSVTAWGIMKLVERGLISLDGPIQKYLNDFSLPKSEFNLNEITIRRLLSNSAGMPLGSLGQEYPPNSEKPSLIEYLTGEIHLSYQPGSKFEYSNPGFNLLELLVEEVTGRDFSDYMKDEVLMPLGMHNSSFEWNDNWSSRVPMGYDLQNHAIPPYVYPYKASGGLFSTVGDIARFAMAEMSPNNKQKVEVLNEKSIQAIHRSQIKTSGLFGFVADGYGYGHFIESLPNDKRAVWHGGQGHGWMTHFHIIPETGDGIVIFTNSQRSWPLIANILSHWSRWTGYGMVKFSRIRDLVAFLWVITGIIFLTSFYLGGRIIYGVITDQRRFSITLQPYSKKRAMQLVLWTILSAILLWSVAQDYLFISSIFPSGIFWLGWGMLFLSFMLLFSIIFPGYKSAHYSS